MILLGIGNRELGIAIVCFPSYIYNSGCTGMTEETAVPCPYNIILGRETALPSPNFGY